MGNKSVKKLLQKGEQQFMVTASLRKQLSLLAVKCLKRQGACMLFSQASWATLHVFYPMKRWHSCKCNKQNRSDLIVVKQAISLSNLKTQWQVFLPILPLPKKRLQRLWVQILSVGVRGLQAKGGSLSCFKGHIFQGNWVIR